MRAAVLAATAAALVAALPAAAAPAARAKPVCRHVTDPANDETTVEGLRPPLVVPDPSVDIESADVAIDARYITAVVRFGDLTDRPVDRRWDRFFFRAAGHTFRFEVLRWYPTEPPSTDTASFSHVNESTEPLQDTSEVTDLAVPSYAYDATTDELRLTVPVATTDAYVRIVKGTKVGSFRVESQRSYSAAVHEVFDSAENARSWNVGVPSCVRPGP